MDTAVMDEIVREILEPACSTPASDTTQPRERKRKNPTPEKVDLADEPSDRENVIGIEPLEPLELLKEKEALEGVNGNPSMDVDDTPEVKEEPKTSVEIVKKKRGRPPKIRDADGNPIEKTPVHASPSTADNVTVSVTPKPRYSGSGRPRGRPRKDSIIRSETDSPQEPTPKRGRGRPRIHPKKDPSEKKSRGRPISNPKFYQKLIQAVQGYPELWDKGHYLFNNRRRKEKSWKSLGSIMDMSDDMVKWYWGIVLTGFSKELKVVEGVCRSTSKKKRPIPSKWIFWEDVHFLKDVADKTRNNDHDVDVSYMFDSISERDENSNITVEENGEVVPSMGELTESDDFEIDGDIPNIANTMTEKSVGQIMIQENSEEESLNCSYWILARSVNGRPSVELVPSPDSEQNTDDGDVDGEENNNEKVTNIHHQMGEAVEKNRHSTGVEVEMNTKWDDNAAHVPTLPQRRRKKGPSKLKACGATSDSMVSTTGRTPYDAEQNHSQSSSRQDVPETNLDPQTGTQPFCEPVMIKVERDDGDEVSAHASCNCAVASVNRRVANGPDTQTGNVENNAFILSSPRESLTGTQTGFMPQSKEKEPDSDELFVMSLLKDIRCINPRQKTVLKMKIWQAVVDVQAEATPGLPEGLN